MNAAIIFCLALLFVFAVALTSVIVLVARNARDAEREDYEQELEELNDAAELCRRQRVSDHRYIHACELRMADAGVPLPERHG